MMIEHVCNGSSSNGFLKGCSSNSGGGDGSGSLKIKTYKRRKFGINGSSSSLVDFDKVSSSPSSQRVKEPVEDLQKNSCDQVFDQKIYCHSLLNGSDDCSFQHGCLKDALNNPCTNEAKEISNNHDGQNTNSNVYSSDVKEHSGLASNGSSSELGHPTCSKMCEKVYFKIYTSEAFSSLRKLFSVNFDGLHIEKGLDFSLVNTRLKEGIYECSPRLFSSDIQQIWRRLHSIGSEMVSLANNLSDMSRDFCHDMGEAAELDTSSDGKYELSGRYSDVRSKWDEPSTSGGINDKAIDELEESSDGSIETGIQVFNGSKRRSCKVCGCTFHNGEEYRSCEHRFCQYKYYHIRCLTIKQLKSYGPRWYCPSCLCRVCLTNKDDDDLVMCDGCDHGYHIYCMDPPHTSIPEGKWFCNKCDVGIKAIRRARKSYEGIERKEMKNKEKIESNDSLKKNIMDFEATLGGSGGMDMLLTAAKTLNEEESGTLDLTR